MIFSVDIGTQPKNAEDSRREAIPNQALLSTFLIALGVLCGEIESNGTHSRTF